MAVSDHETCPCFPRTTKPIRQMFIDTFPKAAPLALATIKIQRNGAISLGS
jgi:hypothetical protein